MSDSDGADRLAMPDVASWPIFPFEGDMRVREVKPRWDVERIRNGDPGGEPCFRCSPDSDSDGGSDGDDLDDTVVWRNERWTVRPLTFNGRPPAFPAYMLEVADHQDFEDLTEEMAAEMGVLSLRLNRAILAIGTVGRVHINRWGDGAAHFHVWFLGRPTGAWQLSGFTLPFWGFILPGLTAEELAANHEIVAASLTEAARAENPTL